MQRCLRLSSRSITQMILLVLALRKKADRLFLAWRFIISLMTPRDLSACQVRKKVHLVRGKH